MISANPVFVWKAKPFYLLQKLHQREWEWVGSDVLFYELAQTNDMELRDRLLLLAGQAHQVIETTEGILEQAEKLESSGFGGYDAIHLASAELGRVDVFLTTDDNIWKISNRNKKMFSFILANPVKWLEEVLK